MTVGAFLHCPLSSHPNLLTRDKRSMEEDLHPIPGFILFLQHTQQGFVWRCFSVRMSRITARSRAVLTFLFLFAVTTPHHRCLVANMVLDPLASVGGMLTILGVLARGADCTDVHLARLIAGVKKASLDVHDISLASGSADVSGYEVSPANSHCSGTRKSYSSCLFSRADGIFPPSHLRPRDGARQGSRVFSGAHQSWSSLNFLTQASSLHALGFLNPSSRVGLTSCVLKMSSSSYLYFGCTQCAAATDEPSN